MNNPKPHTTLSEAVRALPDGQIEILATKYLTTRQEQFGAVVDGVFTFTRAILSAAADLVEQHEAQEPVAWQYRAKLGNGGWSEWRPTTRLLYESVSAGLYEVRELYAQPTLAATQAGDTWQPIETPDPDRDEYCGIGSAVPTHWMPLPPAPTTTRSE